MSMESIMGGLFLINGTDIWTEYGVFLTEEKRGGRDNLKALLCPSGVKEHTAVDIREEDGEKYSDTLAVANAARDVTLTFALYAPTKQEWLKRYLSFISFLKTGEKGWLSLHLPQLDLTLRVFYLDCPGFTPLTYLWEEGVQAGRFKVKFREPKPVI